MDETTVLYLVVYFNIILYSIVLNTILLYCKVNWSIILYSNGQCTTVLLNYKVYKRRGVGFMNQAQKDSHLHTDITVQYSTV